VASTVPAPFHVLRATAAAVATVLVLGGIPGASFRSLEREHIHRVRRQARDGAVNVSVGTSADGSPIAGAHVRVLSVVDDRAYPTGTLDTDAAGYARLSGLPRGEAWILADAPGRARASTHVLIDAAGRSVALSLGPEQTIDVTLRDELSAPVPDAELEVVEAGDPLPVGARAGADGRARVGRLGPGPWRITGHAAGYEDATARAKQDGEAVVLLLRKLAAIRVHVVAQDDHAAGSARVSIAGASLWPPRAATTDPDGDVRIGSLAAGTYALRATMGDSVSPIELDVSVARGEEKTITLRLARGHFVGVRVTDGDGPDADPIGGARVTLAESGLSPFPLEATTDPAGRARIGPIAAGPATLTARADGFVPKGAIAVADPPPAETRVVLVRAGVLTGRVVDARGDPVAGATIEISGTDPSGGPIFEDPRRSNFQTAHFDAMLGGLVPLVPAGELGVVPGPVPPISIARPAAGAGSFAREEIAAWVTGDDGTFRAAPASPGRVRAIVRSPEFVEAQSDVVTLTPGGEAHVDVVMHQGGSLEGRVFDAHDQPVAGARVIASATTGTLERATITARDGTFAFAALPASVNLSVGSDDDEQPQARLAVTVAEGERQEIVVHLPEKREALPVSVVDDRGFGVDTAQVSAISVSADAPVRATAFTDAHGDATLRAMRGLPLRVEVHAPSRAPRIVTTDGKEESLRIEMVPAESASGQVVAARGGDAISGADVTLRTDFGVRRTRTDAGGAFTLSMLAPGNARLEVRATGYAPATIPLPIPDSGGRRALAILPIELQTEGVVEGDVVDAHGAPVAGARVSTGHVPTWLLVGADRQGAGFAVTDAQGRFSLHQVAEGSVALEAYAPGVGRARSGEVAVASGRVTDGIHLVVTPNADDGPDASDPGAASGGIAVTLGETSAPPEVVIVSVVDGSEAERAGVASGDVLLGVDGAPVQTMQDARARLSGPIANDVLLAIRRGDSALTLRVAREAVRR
jgi:Carboxypeptidase regulatory-like domain/PDZ domain